MDSEGKKIDKLRFDYKILSSYTAYPLNGVYGGLNAFGQIVMNCYHERNSIPKFQTYPIKGDGSLANQPIESDPETAIIRNVMFSLYLDPGTARSIAKWLNEKADDCDRLIKKEVG